MHAHVDLDLGGGERGVGEVTRAGAAGAAFKKKKKNEASFAKVSILSAATTEKAEEKREENSQIGHPNRRTSARLPHPMKNSRAVAVLCAARCAFHHIGAEARDIFNEAFVASALRSRTFHGYEICAVPGERVKKKGSDGRRRIGRRAQSSAARRQPPAGAGRAGGGGPARNRETPVRGCSAAREHGCVRRSVPGHCAHTPGSAGRRSPAGDTPRAALRRRPEKGIGAGSARQFAAVCGRACTAAPAPGRGDAHVRGRDDANGYGTFALRA